MKLPDPSTMKFNSSTRLSLFHTSFLLMNEEALPVAMIDVGPNDILVHSIQGPFMQVPVAGPPYREYCPSILRPSGSFPPHHAALPCRLFPCVIPSPQLVPSPYSLSRWPHCWECRLKGHTNDHLCYKRPDALSSLL